MGRRPFKWQFAFRRRFWVNRCFFVDELSNWPTNNRKLIGTCTYHYYSISNWFSPHFEILRIFVKFMTLVWWVICSCHFDSIGLDWLSTLSFLSVAVAVSVISIGLLSFCHLQLRFFFIFYFELSSISLLCRSLSASLTLSLRPICCCWQTSTLPLIRLICVLVWYVNLLYWHFNQRTPLNDEIALLMRSLFFGNRNQSRINNTKHQQ